MSEDDAEEAAERVDEHVEEVHDVYERQNRIVRAAWIAGGLLVVVAGVLLFVVPGGPSTVVIASGLGMLAVVSGSARELLIRSVRRGVEAKDVLEDVDRKAKLLGAAALASLGAAVLAAAIAWIIR